MAFFFEDLRVTFHKCCHSNKQRLNWQLTLPQRVHRKVWRSSSLYVPEEEAFQSTFEKYIHQYFLTQFKRGLSCLLWRFCSPFWSLRLTLTSRASTKALFLMADIELLLSSGIIDNNTSTVTYFFVAMSAFSTHLVYNAIYVTAAHSSSLFWSLAWALPPSNSFVHAYIYFFSLLDKRILRDASCIKLFVHGRFSAPHHPFSFVHDWNWTQTEACRSLRGHIMSSLR